MLRFAGQGLHALRFVGQGRMRTIGRVLHLLRIFGQERFGGQDFLGQGLQALRVLVQGFLHAPLTSANFASSLIASSYLPADSRTSLPAYIAMRLIAGSFDFLQMLSSASRATFGFLYLMPIFLMRSIAIMSAILFDDIVLPIIQACLSFLHSRLYLLHLRVLGGHIFFAEPDAHVLRGLGQDWANADEASIDKTKPTDSETANDLSFIWFSLNFQFFYKPRRVAPGGVLLVYRNIAYNFFT